MPDLATPLALLALPLPLLAARLLPPAAEAGAALDVPAAVGRVLSARAGRATAATGRRFLLPWLIWLTLILALAGPRQLIATPALMVSGRDLAIVLDLSGSMVREDFTLDGRTVSRLQAVQAVGADFVRRRAGDRVALIVFGSEAYYAAPFSFDTESVAHRIEETVIGISGRATNISDGLGLALKRMEASPAASKVVILLSDGVNNAGVTDPRGAAELARSLGVRVHTIALGPKDTESAPDEQNVVDARALAALAELSGGESFRVRTTGDLVAVTDAIDRLEASDAEGLAAEIYRPLWLWPAALSAGLCLVLAWRGG